MHERRSPRPDPVSAAAYGAGQAARLAWYLGHYAATRRWLSRVEEWRRPTLAARLRGLRLQAELARRGLALLRRDFENAAAGLYPMPSPPAPVDAATGAFRYWRDLPQVALRRRQRRADGRTASLPGEADSFPAYYRQSFHDQSGGWLSAESAARYDTQVEVLFGGLAEAMRRQAIPPLAHWLAARGTPDGAGATLLDLGTGTGAMLQAAARAFSRISLHGLDLSPAYIERAKAALGRHPAEWHRAAAESVPLPDASADLVTAVYLLHELPPQARSATLREAARVLRPGGRLVIVDSLQLGDAPALDGLLRSFPDHFHEPYYASWIAADLPALLAEAGLAFAGADLAYLSKVIAADRA